MLLMIYIVLLFVLFFFAYNHQKILIAPEVGFVTCFIPQAVYLLFYLKKWNFNMHFLTFIILSLGVILFVFSSFIFSYLNKRTKKNTYKKRLKYNLNKTFKIDTWKIVFMILIQGITFILLFLFIMSLSSGNLTEAVYYFRQTNLFTEDSITIPSFTRMLRTFSVSSGYVWSYLLIHSKFYDDKVDKILLLINMIISVLNNLILGARTGLVMLFVAIVVQYYIIRGQKYGWKKAMPLKTKRRIIIVTILFVLTFQIVAELMGRTGASNYSFNDYIAGYLCAEVYNFDLFVSTGFFGTSIDTNQTINGIVTILANFLGRPEWIHKIDLPFVFRDGYNFGNLYTIYYPFVRDMGLVGIFVYIPIMAFISQRLFYCAMKSDTKNTISISTIFYSYIFFAIIFSFFSNKFYDQLANTKIIWTIASWYILKYFLSIKFRFR